MKQIKEIHAQIGDIKIGKGDTVLKSVLGSCVGIGFFWKRQGICGLAHCLLPDSPSMNFSIDGRYVTQAIPSLLVLMKVPRSHYHEIEAILVGGGNMTSPHESVVHELVGAANARVACEKLKEYSIKVIYQDLGGEEGRRVTINCWDFTFQVEKFPRIIQAA